MFKGKTIFITGLSSGIGHAVAEFAAKERVKVVVHRRTRTKELEKPANLKYCPSYRLTRTN
ncbi:MAG: SDR family oxidoreductase [Patescibacteria group bacterium]